MMSITLQYNFATYPSNKSKTTQTQVSTHLLLTRAAEEYSESCRIYCINDKYFSERWKSMIKSHTHTHTLPNKYAEERDTKYGRRDRPRAVAV